MADLLWTEEQGQLRSMVRSFFAGRTAGQPGIRSWQATAELGLVGLSVPEPDGPGAALLDELILFEEAGRALTGGAIFPTVALALPVLVELSATSKVRDIVSGATKSSLAWAEEGRPYHLSVSSIGEGLICRDVNGALRITGRRRLVPGLSEADEIVVVGGGNRPAAYLVSLKAQGVAQVSREALDQSSSVGDLILSDTPATPLSADGWDSRSVSRVLARSCLLAAAECIGVAEEVLEMSRAHVGRRTQFGRPIGAFQAVSHPLADIYADIEMVRSLCLLVACRIERGGQPGAIEAGLASRAGSLASKACTTAIQVHGGVGMTWELPLHRYYKRARFLRALLGPVEVHRQAIKTELVRIANSPDGQPED